MASASLIAATAGTTAAATPASPHGRLTSVEYSELSQVLATFKRLQNSKHFSFGLITAGCRKVGASTSLLETQRKSCLADAATLQALENFATAQPRCVAATAGATGTSTTAGATTTGASTTGTTTTGTTTTGTITTATTTTGVPTGRLLQEIVCLDPEYQALGRTATVMYPTDVAARRKAIARGFKGLCLDTLVESPKEIRSEEQFAFSSKHLAADADLLTKVARGQLPASDINAVQLQDDGAGFDEASKAFLNSNSPQKLSVCPHL